MGRSSRFITSRRGFLVAACGAVGALAIVAVTGWLPGRREQLVATVLRDRLGYLRLGEAGVLEFSSEYVRRASQSRRRMIDILSVVRPAYARVGVLRRIAGRTAAGRVEDEICGKYLLSSDFFVNGRDEIRVVEYVRYHDPYEVACSNPFARFGTV